MFETQSNICELLCYILVGLVFGVAYSAKKRRTFLFEGGFYAVFAVVVFAVATAIPFAEIGWQTVVVPLATAEIARVRV